MLLMVNESCYNLYSIALHNIVPHKVQVWVECYPIRLVVVMTWGIDLFDISTDKLIANSPPTTVTLYREIASSGVSSLTSTCSIKNV